jgi:N-acetylneuraminic acid mutarotase
MLQLLPVLAALLAAPAWQELPPGPEARSEVAAAGVDGRVAVVGGFRRDGASSARVDLYDPAARAWERLPELPVAVNHAMAAARGRTLYVVGGYVPDGTGHHMHAVSRRTFALQLTPRGAQAFAAPRWRELRPLPAPRAAAGTAIVGTRLYVLGGVRAPGRLVRTAYVLGLRTGRWSAMPGPSPREHLGVAALGRRVYVLAGRTAGFDTNRRTAEAWDVVTRRWRTLPALPTACGGCSAAAVGGRVVIAGGEADTGTIPAVQAYAPATRRWTQLPPLEEPRHGLGVAGLGRTLYVLLGGPTPGLDVTTTSTALRLP